ncbi:recombinase, partial [Gammaproteobacteria bacterium]|nr:recombinase [Gammaproteobacteria bacterium]
DYGITMDIICGNHDTFYKNTNELNSLKELLGHYMNEVTIIHKPKVMEYGSLKMGLIPWINEENSKEALDFLAKAKCDIIGGHFDIIGYEMLQGIKCEHGLDRSMFNRFEAVYSGHFHTKSTQDNITYLGSQMEFFWNDAHDKKYFHVLDTETRSLDAIHNPHTLFHRIRYDDTTTDYLHYDLSDIDGRFVKVQVINKSDQYTFDRFIDRLQNRKILELKIAENFNEFIGDNVEDTEVSVDDTSVLLDSYIDAVETDLDKDRIKKQMSDLMTEAQSFEIV